ncbi:MAG: sulfatase-like hydrolase/transferase [Bacilli bacterium]|nr:sulfatase-like hydrolase/transferase [Bacilli bacterium]
MKKKNKARLAMVFFLTILYMELVFQIFTVGLVNLFSAKTIYVSLFAIITSVTLSFICKIFKNDKVSRRIALGIILFLGIYYFGVLLFKELFNTYFSIHLIGVSDQAIAFVGDLVREVLKRIPLLLLFMLPYLFVLRYRKKISYILTKENVLSDVIYLVLSLVLFIFLVNVNSVSKNLFYEVDNNAANVEKLGINVATYLDVKRIFSPIEEAIILDIPKEQPAQESTEYGYNNMNIDFNSLANSTSNKTLKSMHEYFGNQSGTLKNEYTGLYKDKNLIVVMAESLNTIAISEKYTPTLYKLSHEGMEFTNFYTPINLSTLGGEFQNLTGLFANLSVLSNQYRKGNNYYPFGLGNVYKKLDYSIQAYHPNSGYFQDRNRYLKNMGFDKFVFNGNGLEKLMNCNLWPQSDYDMVNVTIDDFINDDKFMTYYVSVSGHMPWSYSGNSMSVRNKEKVADSNYSTEAAAYIAANIELDKAIELIMQKLSDANKLDDTVIAIVPDHYPYSMNINTINELSDYERDSKFEVNHSTLILYNSTQEHKVIDKYISQLDVLPTIYNLFDIEYDSRLIMGKDIFSTSEGIVYFNDRSWITAKGRYDATRNKFTSSSNEEVSNEYIENIKKIVASRINMSKLIMEQDYYKIVLGD